MQYHKEKSVANFNCYEEDCDSSISIEAEGKPESLYQLALNTGWMLREATTVEIDGEMIVILCSCRCPKHHPAFAVV